MVIGVWELVRRWLRVGRVVTEVCGGVCVDKSEGLAAGVVAWVGVTVWAVMRSMSLAR